MTSNKEWLDNLAATDPQALQAWFDAPCDESEQVDGNHSKADSDDFNVTQKEPVSLRDLFGILSDAPKCSEKLRNEQDNREQLGRDITRWLDSWTGASVHESEIRRVVCQWLDRQAAITRAECDKPNWEYCETCDYERANERQARKIENVCAINAKLREHVDNLAQDLAESERLREELREELSIAYDHAHDLLARRDRGLV